MILLCQKAAWCTNKMITNKLMYQSKMTKNDPSVHVFGSVHYYINF